MSQLASSLPSTQGMETLEVSPYDTDNEEQTKDEDPVWGRLFPLQKGLPVIDLSNPEYTMGRNNDCDVLFKPGCMKHNFLSTISKVHCKLSREESSTGTHFFIKDTSSNGTFLNREKIGKGERRLLKNNDEICFSTVNLKVYVFMDASNHDDLKYPDEIREKYTISKILGSGACGEVRLAFVKGSCERVAVKIIHKKKFTIHNKNQLNQLSYLENEIKIMKTLQHPCIIKILDVVNTPNILFMVLELVEGGELFDRVVSSGRLPESIAKLYAYQMVLAVNHLHSNGIAHRDLKPENILLSSDDDETLVKVTDFGLSKFIDGESVMKTFCGTPNYLAPEVLSTAGHGEYTTQVDCWSLGVVLFACLGGYPPFSSERKDMPLPKQILSGNYVFSRNQWQTVSQDARDFVKQLLTVDPQKRITLQQALEHRWFNDPDMKMKADSLMSTSNGVSSSLEDSRSNGVQKRSAEETSRSCSPESDTTSRGSLEVEESIFKCPAKKLKTTETPPLVN